MSAPSTDNREVLNMADSIQRQLSILRRKQVQARTGLARSTIYLHIQNGTFPSPVPLGPRAVGWLESEINDWIAGRVRIARGDKKSGG
jgi:prophage regulatory protein